MGQFSWISTDTNMRIYNDGTEQQTVKMVFLDGDKVRVAEEKEYAGYGEFGGYDYYAVLASMNNATKLPIPKKQGRALEEFNGECRGKGIDLYFAVEGKKDVSILYPQLYLGEVPKLSTIDFTRRVKDDPHQGWGPGFNRDDADDYDTEA